MLKTACPMLAGTLAMSGYNIADTFFVGQLGGKRRRAMGFTFPVVTPPPRGAITTTR